MMNDHFDHALPHEELHHAAPKLLVAIVNRADTEKTAELLRQMRFHFLLGCRAEGTAGAGFADILGFGPPYKTVLFGIAPDCRIHLILAELKAKLHLEKPNHGIAFTVPLSGIALPHKIPVDAEKKTRMQSKLERGVEEVLETIEHDLILAVVNQGHSEALMERAQAAGAKGGTVLNAHYLGAEEAVKFLGVPLQAEKELVLILVSRGAKAGIMAAIDAFQQEEPKSHGALLSLPVESVAGMSR